MNENKTNINWYPGHMAKTKKQIIEDLKLIDVVVEILDARLPKASQNPDLQEWIKTKRKIIVLNKSDLADEKVNKEWIEYYERNNIPAILTDSNSGKGIRETVSEIEKIAKEENEQAIKKGRTGKQTRVMIVGIPNVGKSSFINRVTKRSSATVGNRPGVTKQKQWISLKNGISLLDTPGILWPKLDQEKEALNLAFVGTIKDNIIQRIDVAYYLLKYLLENKIQNLLDRYNLDKNEINNILENKDRMENENILEIMHLIGRKRGAILQGDNVDEEKTANLLLDEFRSGKIGRISLERPE